MKQGKRWFIAALAFAAALIVGADAVYQWHDRAYLNGLGALARLNADGRYDLAALGYNTAPVAPRKEPGSYRILVFGDSFMHGITTAQYTPAAFLQSRLKDLLPGRDIEVVNLGVPSVSFPEYIANHRFWAQRLEHDAVIFNIFTGNDFTDIGVSVPHSILGDGLSQRDDVMVSTLSLARRPHWWLLPLYQGIGPWLGMGGNPDIQGPMLPHDPRYEGNAQFSEASYLRIMEIAARPYREGWQRELAKGYDWAGRLLAYAGTIMASGKLVLVTIAPSHVAHAALWQQRVLQAYPRQGAIDPLLPGRRLTLLQAERGGQVLLLDLTPGMQAAEDRGVSTFRGLDSHWSIEGNEAAAALIAPLLANLIAPERP